MRLSWPELTQNAARYVLGLGTPLLRQGEVTGFFFRTFLVLFVKASVFCLNKVAIAILFKNRLGLSLPRGAYAPGDLVLFVQNNI